LLACYKTFDISITNEDMQDKCTDIYKANMLEELDDFNECLVNLGASMTADKCLLSPENVDFQLDKRLYNLKSPDDYQTCLNETRIYPEAYSCK
jgi:hypothetical protein